MDRKEEAKVLDLNMEERRGRQEVGRRQLLHKNKIMSLSSAGSNSGVSPSSSKQCYISRWLFSASFNHTKRGVFCFLSWSAGHNSYTIVAAAAYSTLLHSKIPLYVYQKCHATVWRKMKKPLKLCFFEEYHCLRHCLIEKAEKKDCAAVSCKRLWQIENES